MPVIAAGYGFSTSRAALYEGQDPLTEQQQGWLTQSLEETFKEASDTLWNTTYEECLRKFQEEGVTYIEVDREAFVKSAEEIAAKFDGELFRTGLYEQIKGLK